MYVVLGPTDSGSIMYLNFIVLNTIRVRIKYTQMYGWIHSSQHLTIYFTICRGPMSDTRPTLHSNGGKCWYKLCRSSPLCLDADTLNPIKFFNYHIKTITTPPFPT